MESENRYYYKVASPEYIKQADEVFNEELTKQLSGEYDRDHTNHIYKLGYPGEILQAAGFPDNKIEMLASQLTKKSVQKNHPFDIVNVKGLVNSLNNPIAVFVYGAKSKAQNVITELEQNGKKFLIGVHFNQEHRGTVISDIRGIHPRDNAEWLHWIQQGKLLYADKDKIQNAIAEQRSNPAEVNYLDLDFVAKIIKNFENPKFSMENVMIMDDYYNEALCHPAEIVENQVPAISNTTDNDKGKKVGKGWAALLNGTDGEKAATVAAGKEQTHVTHTSQTDAEKALHDKFEELIKEQEKQDKNQELKL